MPSCITCRDLKTGGDENTAYFSPNSDGLADNDQQPFYDNFQPQTAYVPQSCGSGDCDIVGTPPLWVNFNRPVVAPKGQVLTTASLTPANNRWSCYESDVTSNYGCGSALNIKMQAADVTMVQDGERARCLAIRVNRGV